MKLTLELRTEIQRLSQVERWPIGTIARHLHLHHGVVRRALMPKKTPRPPRVHLLEPYLPTLRELLERYPGLTATRLHFSLRELGYPGGVAQVRRAIRKYKLRPSRSQQAYTELVALPGQEAQVDWAHVGKLTIGHAQRPVWALLVVLSYSRDLWVGFYHDMSLTNVLDGHRRAFAHFGGVPRRILYDNMKTVVLERVADAVRFQPDFLECAAHYGFEPVACRPYRPNEKGRVERKVRDLRSALLEGNSFGSLAEYDAAFWKWRSTVLLERALTRHPRLTVGEALLEDQARLLALPQHGFEVEIRRSIRVGKTPWISVDGNRYSLPHTMVGKTVSVVATAERVLVREGEQAIAEHERSWDKGKRIDDPAHLRAFAQEQPRSSHRAHDARRRLLDAVPQAKTLLLELAARQEHMSAHTRALVRLLDAVGPEALGEAISQALERNTPRASAVAWILKRDATHGQTSPLRPEVALSTLAEEATPSFALQALEDYDAIYDPAPFQSSHAEPLSSPSGSLRDPGDEGRGAAVARRPPPCDPAAVDPDPAP